MHFRHFQPKSKQNTSYFVLGGSLATFETCRYAPVPIYIQNDTSTRTLSTGLSAKLGHDQMAKNSEGLKIYVMTRNMQSMKKTTVHAINTVTLREKDVATGLGK